jgi:hypothetical protein
MKLPILLFGALAAISFPVALSAQVGQLGTPLNVGEKFRDVPALPTPRMPDGRVNLGAVPGQVGLWFPSNSVAKRIVNPDDMPADSAPILRPS